MRSLVKYNPGPTRVLGDFDRLFDAFFHETPLGRAVYPRVDVREDDGLYTLEAELPGLTERDIEVKVEDNLLTISSASAKESKEEKDGYVLNERRNQTFSRAFVLPKDVDRETIEAGFSNGLLTLSLQKTPEARPKMIEVKGK